MAEALARNPLTGVVYSTFWNTAAPDGVHLGPVDVTNALQPLTDLCLVPSSSCANDADDMTFDGSGNLFTLDNSHFPASCSGSAYPYAYYSIGLPGCTIPSGCFEYCDPTWSVATPIFLNDGTLVSWGGLIGFPERYLVRLDPATGAVLNSICQIPGNPTLNLLAVPLTDCNGNGIDDLIDIANCPGDPTCGDCNANGIPDECDIANCPPGNPACRDCNANGVPDGCEGWELRSTVGPSPRGEHAMAYDSDRGVTVLFGGWTGTGDYSSYGDTWEWDGATWTERTPPAAEGSPSPRFWHATAYDSTRGVTVLFGGLSVGYCSDGYCGDTWEWDGTTWTQRSNTGPAPRYIPSMAYDSARNVTVLFGGYNGTFSYGDTWEWDGAAWILVHPGDPSGVNAPSARHGFAMPYDSTRSVTVLFGGHATEPALTYFGDTWEWDGSSWMRRCVNCGPAPRFRHELAFDSVRQISLMFGGKDTRQFSGYFGDTWQWDGTAWTLRTNIGPSPREDTAMAFDTARGVTVLFGGLDLNGVNGETWEFNPREPSDCNANGIPDECDIRDCPPLDATCLDCNMNQIPDGCEGGPSAMCPNDCTGHGFCDCDTCICDAGWSGLDCSMPICDPICVHGNCKEPNVCNCEPGWTGPPCDVPICGDGMILGAEECDDNNTLDGDGCSASCTVEPRWVCTGQPSVCNPDCNQNGEPDVNEGTTTVAFRVQCPNPPGPCADGVPWSFLIDWDGPDITGDCGPVPLGGNPPDLSRAFAQCIVDAIEAAGLEECQIAINQPGNGAVFRVTVPGPGPLAICVGPAGGPANCCVADNNDRCAFNPELVLFVLPTIPPTSEIQAHNRALDLRIEPPVTSTGIETAIQVTMIDLQNPVPHNFPCCPPPDFSNFESGITCTDPSGCARWVGKPGSFLESQDRPGLGSFRGARLQCTPYYRDWSTIGEEFLGSSDPDDDLFHIAGAEIIPSSTYRLRIFPVECMGDESNCFAVSEPVTMVTRRSGDVEALFQDPPPASLSQPNAIDVAQLVNKVKNVVGALIKPIAQLQPNLPELNADVNVLDIVACVDALKGFAYYFGGPCPCPSLVPCGPAMGSLACADPAACVAAFGPESMCVKTCVGGTNAGEPCIKITHCQGGTSCGNAGPNPGCAVARVNQPWR